ncbi:hypothetical protein ENBRE01_3010 [Enteropsectra breve]|nr:hypothetical protein ENBRE01_3010 [Enteropsectra breve]
MTKHLTNEQPHKIVSLYYDRMTQAELANKYDVTQPAIHKILKKSHSSSSQSKFITTWKATYSER